jgi:protocatechuate 3,4-dioxygenase beta subunit
VTTATGLPIAGVTMTLTGAATGTTTTNAAGTYTFTGLVNGVYTVTPTLAGYTFNPLNRIVTISGANITGQNFTGTGAVTYFIRGYVKDSNGNLMSGVTMTLSGAANATIFTDSSGNYQFSGLLPGSYVVMPGFPSYVFSPTSRFITITNASFTGQEFEGRAGRR